MNSHYLANLRKAARAELLDYGSADDWSHAGLAVAKEYAAEGETAEQAFARLSTLQGHEVHQLEKMRRLTRDNRGRKPAPVAPAILNDSELAAQDRLNRMVLRKVAEANCSYEQAYAAVTETDAGRALWRAIR